MINYSTYKTIDGCYSSKFLRSSARRFFLEMLVRGNSNTGNLTVTGWGLTPKVKEIAPFVFLQNVRHVKVTFYVTSPGGNFGTT